MPVPDRFTRFAVIDWSGAKGAFQSGIAVAVCQAGNSPPMLVDPPGKAWSRQAVLDWLRAQADTPTLIGLDLSPSLPFVDCGAFFPGWDASPADAQALWALVEVESAGDPHFAASRFVAHPQARRHFRQHRDLGDLFEGGRGRLRVCEWRQLDVRLSPTSCFNLIGAAQVGKSSLTGMRVLAALDGAVPAWPFHAVPRQGALIVEIYTTIAARAAGLAPGRSKIRDAAALDAALRALGVRGGAALTRYDDHATDAVLTAAWLRNVAADEAYWTPAALTETIARTEGWTFGVT